MTQLRHHTETAAPWLPARDAVDEALRQTRRALVDVRHATEDLTADAVLKVRRHPLASVGLAVCAGTLAGAAIGFSMARSRRRS